MCQPHDFCRRRSNAVYRPIMSSLNTTFLLSSMNENVFLYCLRCLSVIFDLGFSEPVNAESWTLKLSYWRSCCIYSNVRPTNGKRPNGVSLVPWQSGKSMCWDVTVTCPLVEWYIDRASHEAGAATEVGASLNENKYVDLGLTLVFVTSLS